MPTRPSPDQPQDLSPKLDAQQLFLGPLPFLEKRIGPGNRACKGSQESHGVLGDADRIAARRIHHQNALLGSGFEIDVIDSHTGPAHDPQLAAAAEQFLCDLRGAADNEAVRLNDFRLKLPAGFRQKHHFPAVSAKDLQPASGDIVCYNDFHQDFLFPR